MEITAADVSAVMALALLSGFTTLIGVTFAIWLGKHIGAIAIGVGFSVAIMLLIACAELIPEAINEAGILETTLTVVAGTICIAFLNYLVPHEHLHQEHGTPFAVMPTNTAYLVALGLILHDFPEGFAMANAYMAEPSMGATVAIAIALHNIPEEFVIALPLVATQKRRVLYFAAGISALAEPCGAAIGLFAVHFQPGLNAIFLAFAAGAMIFISVHELLPLVRTYQRRGWFAAGMVLSVLTYVLLATTLPE